LSSQNIGINTTLINGMFKNIEVQIFQRRFELIVPSDPAIAASK
jgi:hypothetical protein